MGRIGRVGRMDNGTKDRGRMGRMDNGTMGPAS